MPVYATSVRVSLNALRSAIVMLLAIMCIPFWSARADNTKPASAANVSMSLLTPMPANGFKPGDQFQIQVQVTNVDNSDWAFQLDIHDYNYIGKTAVPSELIRFGQNAILLEAEFSHGLFMRLGENPQKVADEHETDLFITPSEDSDRYSWVVDSRFRNGALSPTDVATLVLTIEYISYDHYGMEDKITATGVEHTFQANYFSDSNSPATGFVSQDLLIDFTDVERPTGVRTYTSKFAPSGLQAGEFMMVEVGIINYGSYQEVLVDLELNQGIMPYPIGFYGYPFTSGLSGNVYSYMPLTDDWGYMFGPVKSVESTESTQEGDAELALFFNPTDMMFKVKSVDSSCYENYYIDAPICDMDTFELWNNETRRIFIQGSATLEEAGDAFEMTGTITSGSVCKVAPGSVNCKETAGDATDAIAAEFDVEVTLPIAPITFEKTVNEECFETGDVGNFNVRLAGADFRKIVGFWYVADLVPSGVKPESITPNFLLSEMPFNPDLGIVVKELNGGFVYLFNGLFSGISNLATKVTSLPMPSKLSTQYNGPDFSYLDEFVFDLGFSIDESTEPGNYVNTAKLGFISIFSLISLEAKQADESEPEFLTENGFIVITEEIEDEFAEILFEELFYFFEIGTVFEASAEYTVGCYNLSVSGYKYEDHNANGVRDQGEQGLYGWTITVQGSNGTFTATTDQNGFYMIDGLKPGVYQVREESREGWYQSAPAGEGFYNISLTEQRSTAKADFGNFRKAMVYGFKYVDLDGSGSREEGEPAMEGVRVFLNDLSGNLVAEALTDEEGYFVMTGLMPGHYALFEDIPQGMYQSQPGPAQGGFYNFELRSGYHAGPNMFGNYYLTSVTGDVYYTTDISFKGADGKVLNTRSAAPGVTVSGVRTGPAPLKPSSGDPVVLPGSSTFEVLTDDDGHFHVDGLLPGLYTVSVTPPDEYTSVITENPLTEVLVSGGYVEVEFGLYYDELAAPEVRTSSITGSLYRDADANGLWAYPSETGLEGRTVTLVGTSKRGAAISLSTTSGPDGSYTFAELPEGQYLVYVQSAAGASIGAPLSASYAVVLGENQSIGQGGNGAPGGSGWLQSAMAGEDETFARMTLALDLDLDGVADTRIDVSGNASFELGGITGQNERPMSLTNVQMYGMDTNGGLLTLTTPGLVQQGGSLSGAGSQTDKVFGNGLILSDGDRYWMSEGALTFEGSADRWPMRHSTASFLGSPINMRDPNGNVVARIMYAEMTTLFGPDFAVERADFGDAPSTFGTLRATTDDAFVITADGIVYPNDGARHLLPWNGSPALTLGSGVTADANGQPTASADSDTDDGVELPDAVAPNAPFTASVTVTGEGLLSVWVDANRNGVFEPSERQVSDESVETGEYEVTLHSGATTSSGTTMVRFRLTTQPGVAATGVALDGEVEDYLLTIDAAMAGSGGGLPTSEDGDSAVPTSFALHQNYPNPFNPSTVIPYDLAKSGQVRITVYDVTGRPVATVLDANQNAGRHQVTFDAAGLPSGVYMVRLEAGGQVMVRKLTLLK